MLNPRTLNEKLLFSTLRLLAEISPKETSVGTGFFFTHRLPDKGSVLLLITNRHVVEGTSRTQLQFHEGDSTGKHARRFHKVTVDHSSQGWIPHPNPVVDLCALLAQPLLDDAARQGKRLTIMPLTEENVATDEELQLLDVVEDILMVGYPTGLWDEVNKLPLIRHGITASHPSLDFCGRSEMVVDVACFPGSSGSPILIQSPGVILGKDMTFFQKHGLALLGVLYAGPSWTAEGEIKIKHIPTSAKQITETPIMMHLGFVIKAKEIVKLANHVVGLT